MFRAGSIDGYTILAGLVVVGTVVFLVYSFLRPLAVSTYNRFPGLSFPQNSLRIKTLWKEKQANGWRWLTKRLIQTRRSLLTYWSFIWVVPLGFLLVVSLGYLSPSLIERVQPDLVQHGWQAQLTITSLSFIVLIFLLEQISRTEYRAGVIQEFFASSRIMPVIYFTLSSSGLIAYLYFAQTPTNVPQVVVNTTFFTFLGTISGIGYVYYRVARLIFFDPLDEMVVEEIQRGVDLQLREDRRQDIANEMFEQQLPAFVERNINHDGRLFMAQELGLNGFVADINLAKLKRVCNNQASLFDGTEKPTLLLNVHLGQELQPGVDIVSVDEATWNSTEVSDEFITGLADAIYCTSSQPWKTGEQLVDRNLNRIGEDTRNAVNSLNPTQLEKNFDYYVDLLQHLIEVNREVIQKHNTTPGPIANLVDHIYRELYHILDAAAQTGSTDLINTVRGELYRLSMAHHRQDESLLFGKSINLYASYYQVLVSSPAVGSGPVHRLLTSLSNIQTLLTGALGRARTVEEADSVVSDIENFYEVLESILRISVQEGDYQTFNNVWNLGSDRFLLIQPDRDVYQLEWELEEADNQEEQERIQQELAIRERQQEAVEDFQEGFTETRFIAAAWAYREVREENLGQETFQEMFSESIKSYSFTTLAEVYLRICDTPGFDPFRWETEDADIFKGARMSTPAVQTWLKEFFCAMGLLFLEADQYEIAELDKGDNPMADIAINRSNYPDLTETIRAVSEDELAKTGITESELNDLDEGKAVFLALHQQMEELLERREENQVIDADLDQEKVTNFKENYTSEFKDQLVLRTVFEDLGWLTVQSYTEDLGVDPSGTKEFYPKGGFISESSGEFIHSLDRRAKNHTELLLETWFENEQPNLAEIQLDSYEQLPNTVVQTCLDLADEEQTPRAILLGRFRARTVVTDSDYFEEDFQPSEDVIGGFTYDDEIIPVYEDSARDFHTLILTGSDQPAELIEYQRDNAPVFVAIEKVTRELLDELDPEGLEELSEEEIREKLQRVWLRIFYYAQFNATEEFGTILRVDE